MHNKTLGTCFNLHNKSTSLGSHDDACEELVSVVVVVVLWGSSESTCPTAI